MALRLAALLLATSLAYGQPAAKPPRVGLLLQGSAQADHTHRGATFREGLRELGWVEGQTIHLATSS